MLRRRLISPIFCLIFLLASPKALAQDFSLEIYPPIIQIDAQAPSDITTPITIENSSSETMNLTIQLRQFVPSELENGEITFVREADPPHRKLFSKVRIKEGSSVRKQITLLAKQKKNLILEINLDKEEDASDYYFSIVFISNPLVILEKSQSSAAGGIATNVLLSVGEKELPSGRITDFKAPFFVTKGPVGFKVRVENQSPFFISTEGNILIKNIFGQTIGNLELLPLNILGKSARLLGNKEGLEKNLEMLQAIWGEKFLLGAYTADLTVTLSEAGPILREKTTFIAVPLEIIIGFLVISVIVAFIYKRVKKKMETYEQV